MARETASGTARRGAAAGQGPDAVLRVTLVRSTIGYNKNQMEVVRGLGLRRIGQTVVVKDHPAMRGMIAKVAHLVRVGP